MRKKAKIIEIKGFRGIIMIAFVAACLFAGFVLFPAKAAVYLWNYTALNFLSLPLISLWQGILLWASIALSIYIVNSKRKMLSFKTTSELSEEEMQTLMERIKIQAEARRLNSLLLKEENEKKDDSEKIDKKDVSEKHS